MTIIKCMVRRMLLIGCSLFFYVANAQVTTVSGIVTDAKKRPLQGVSVGLKDSYDGTTTDSLGKFRFSTSDTGKIMIAFTSLGYKSIEQIANFTGTPLVFEVMLKEAPNELQAVVITAGSFEASDEKKITVLRPLDIVTTASANADVSAAMKTLPGTQQVGESAELFVRGGEGYETRQFIDGMVVANPFFGAAPDIASRGRFSPFLFKGTVFSTGGYSALYGQALSSALVLESIDLPERTEASASISPIFLGAQYQHLAATKKSSWGASANYSNIGLYFKVVPQKPDFFKAPNTYNIDANFRIKTSATGMLKMYANYASNTLGIRTSEIDQSILKNAFSLTNGNLYTNLSYRERLGNRTKMKAGLSVSNNYDNLQQQLQDATNEDVNTGLPSNLNAKNFTLTSNALLAQARVVIDYKLRGLSGIKWGGEYWFSQDKSVFNTIYTNRLKDHFASIFGEADIYLSNEWAIRLGLRSEYSSLLQKVNIAPRTSIAFKLNKTAQLSADYGIFYQKAQSQFLRNNAALPFMKASHYIVTYQRMDAVTTFRVQMFHKDYKQLQKTWPDTTAKGTGYASGLEFFWRDKKTFKGFDYWLTYSYLDTKRNYLNFPYEMRPNFAAKHTANVVVKRFFTKLNAQINMNYQVASGRPYYDLALNSSNLWQIRDHGTTIAYHNVSMSINYLTNIKRAFAVAVFSLTNSLNQNQVFGYRYSADGSNKVAVTPPARQFFFLGLFLSWGADRRQDAIDNNL